MSTTTTPVQEMSYDAGLLLRLLDGREGIFGRRPLGESQREVARSADGRSSDADPPCFEPSP